MAGGQRDDRLDRALATYRSAAAWNQELVGRVRADRWGAPGLGTWTVLELVAHTSRACTTVVDYLRPTGTPDTHSAAEYYRRALGAADASIHAAVAQRGRDEAAAVAPDPLAVVTERCERAIDAVTQAGPEAVAATPFGTLAIADYLLTRVVELVVHTIDLAGAIGVEAEPPADAGRLTVQVLAELAAEPSPSRLLRALTGRGALPDGFNVFA